jgi:hypothetical protein
VQAKRTQVQAKRTLACPTKLATFRRGWMGHIPTWMDAPHSVEVDVACPLPLVTLTTEVRFPPPPLGICVCVCVCVLYN